MNRFVMLIFVFLFSATAVVFLNHMSTRSDEYKFERVASGGVLTPDRIWDIGEQSCYVAGKSGDQIFLGSNHRPGVLKIVNIRKGNSVIERTICIPGHPPKATSILVDSSDFYLLDLLSYEVFRGSVANLEPVPLMYHPNFFAEAVPVSKSTLIVRTFDKDVREYVLARQTMTRPFIFRVQGLLQKQIDGLFCTDGMLQYDQETSHVVYVYFYRNQFLCMDTSLNLLYRAKTIDPIEKARIKVARIESENAITLASPPYIVNNRSHASGCWLFINSEIKASNEDITFFRKVSVIDVYRLLDGAYQFSFYLPRYKGNRVKEFKVFGDTFVSIQGHYLLCYTMPAIQ